MEDSDLTAIAGAKAGNPDSFRLLVERYSRGVFRVAYRMTANEFDAEDVVQETFLRAYRQLPSYESRSSFSTWLHRIAVNYALDLIRIRQKHESKRARSLSEEIDLVETARSADAGQDRLVYSQQVQSRIEAALAELSEQERTAFLLRHCEGQSIEQIGQVLGTAGSATKNSIFRAVRKLRAVLEPVSEVYNAARNG